MDLLLGPSRAKGKSLHHIVNVPITVRFLSDGRRWSMSNGKLFHVEDSPGGLIEEGPVEYNAWTIREEFLDMKTEADLMTFLDRTGVFFGPSESGRWTVADLFDCKVAVQQLLRT
jgi:hypothetical protein